MTLRLLTIICAAILWVAPAKAQEFRALARAIDGASTSDMGASMAFELSMTQAVPFRVYTLSEPSRVVFDFNEVDFTSANLSALSNSVRVSEFAAGAWQPGWSRLVLELSEPLELQAAAYETLPDQSAKLFADFSVVSPEDFAASAGRPDEYQDQEPVVIDTNPVSRRKPGEVMRVVLDPGHGGIDPGAEVDGDVEANTMLHFARELKEVLLRTGAFEVELTRDADYFVPLERRISIAKAFGAHVFISLHADVVTEGDAHGATIYTLSDAASDIASQKLAERHDRRDLLSGVDLTEQDDTVALVLMDMARTDTAHRTGKLADAMVDALSRKVELYKKPRLEAGFSVLKAPDIPSLLVELGFMSSRRDLENLRNPEWRTRAAVGLRDGLLKWAKEDAAEAELRLK